MSHFHHSLALRCLSSLLLATGVAWAFPPAPSYTLCGEDLDKDGLPDTWEAWHLYQTAARIARVHRPY